MRTGDAVEAGLPEAPGQPVRELLPLIPREHGAWAMLLLPFGSATILARAWTPTLLAALAAVLAVFVLRESLVVLLRQRYVWRHPRPEAAAARRSFEIAGPTLALAGLWLLLRVPWNWLLPLGVAALLLTGVYAYGALENRRRSAALHVGGAIGLSSSALLAYLAAGQEPDKVILLLWTVHVVHNAGSVLVVHARLEALIASKTAGWRHARRRRGVALAWQLVQAALAAALGAAGRPLLAAALLLPLAFHAVDLFRLRHPNSLRTPLKRVGLRELALSSAFSMLALAALW